MTSYSWERFKDKVCIVAGSALCVFATIMYVIAIICIVGSVLAACFAVIYMCYSYGGNIWYAIAGVLATIFIAGFCYAMARA